MILRRKHGMSSYLKNEMRQALPFLRERVCRQVARGRFSDAFDIVLSDGRHGMDQR